jgi:ABC-type enterochelin transport system ATPase subunit
MMSIIPDFLCRRRVPTDLAHPSQAKLSRSSSNRIGLSREDVNRYLPRLLVRALAVCRGLIDFPGRANIAESGLIQFHAFRYSRDHATKSIATKINSQIDMLNRDPNTRPLIGPG